MTLDVPQFNFAQLVGVVEGLVLIAVGLLAALVKPRTRPPLLLGAYFVMLGVASVASPFLQGDLELLVVAIFFVFAATALALLIFAFPAPLRARDARQFPVELALALIAAIAFLGGTAGNLLAFGRGGNTNAGTLDFVAQGLLYAAQSGFVALLAGRFGHEASADTRRAYALLATGIGLVPSAVAGFALNQGPVILTACIVASAASIGAWIIATRGRGSGVARNVALTLAVAMLAGQLEAAGLFPFALSIAFTASALLVAYAVMRASLFGLDTKVRFALSKSAVAAVFLGAFFVASQIAQNWFGSAYGPVFGGITAGLLLFAISPIQRMAERVASAAVPIVTVASVAAVPEGKMVAAPASRAEESYRKAVRRAFRGGRLSRLEEKELHELARDLGIDGVRAHDIIVEAEEETGVT